MQGRPYRLKGLGLDIILLHEIVDDFLFIDR